MLSGMLRIADSHRRALLSHSERAYPAECCGVLLGQRCGEDLEVRAVVACTNQALRKTTRYEIPPRDLLCAQKLARAARHEIIGFYHSHPEHDAVASKSDVDEAFWSDAAYVIIPVKKAHAGEMRAYRCVVENGTRLLREEPHGVAEAATMA